MHWGQGRELQIGVFALMGVGCAVHAVGTEEGVSRRCGCQGEAVCIHLSSPCPIPFRSHGHLSVGRLEWGPRLAAEQAHMACGRNSWLWSH